MELTAQNVREVFEQCLENENVENKKLIEGLVMKVYFNPERLKNHEYDIISMLDCLHSNFKSEKIGGGGGWSFGQMCDDKNDNQWTCLHKDVEMLVMLGIGIDKVKYLLPRPLWKSLPLGLPYIVIE
jgi:hypothetical protein